MPAETKTPPSAAWAKLEDPELFLAIEDLELAAQGIVEGALQGLHRSPFRGHGAEFESHREYLHGDDLRYLDWNLFARHGRYFTKQFRAETNLNLYLLLDATGSMGTHRGPATKFRYAARAAAALALLTHRTRDSAGVFLLRNGIAEALPPRSRRGHFQDLVALLESTVPAGASDLGSATDAILDACRRRGMVVLFSDFFDQEEALLRLLRSLRQQGHQVLAFQTLDPWECELPESGDYEFADLETGQTLKTSAPEIRAAYARTVAAWRQELGAKCEASGVGWISVTTADSLVQAVRTAVQTSLSPE
jgi:uncharacterized protein (DUF58 family)